MSGTRQAAGSKSLDPKIVEALSKYIYRGFPEVRGIKPKVRKQPLTKVQKEKGISPDKRNYLLIFKRNVSGPKGQVIPRWVRVVASPKGKLIKITTSK